MGLSNNESGEVPVYVAAAAAAAATGDKEKNYRHSEETYQAGSPFNSLPPFNYAQSNLSRSGSDVASHRRAFSSYTPSTSSRGNDNVNPFASEHEDDEWDLDAAWHEMQRVGGGRRKRGNRMVVLGGTGGRRR